MERWRCWFCPRFCLWNVGDVGSVLCSAYGTLEMLVVRWNRWLCPGLCLEVEGGS